ncbi:Fructoselysine-6-P-deglycase FrlB with duplicated sugar isomerase (SIS) domain [Jatrophihabitans endophyticus]|uniref:Fructoselysine-6-P-deglycase FrlB with duplicated sugar isomerase (SIS) domain n=1 Tax=Jatrophihabitans endophyticus TaxID=1206085 RepID=A0A1M5HEA4_9ACTN|nr:sugar isomerase [Jatrophihabitans endophyticus]SHG14247.1 Fructoselysine-6-P-deglycase FrlB with duplicated sugar isomerase (SIS) domain [Jatrophihabitans endophyticus]
MSHVSAEIADQPGCWRRAAELATTDEVVHVLPKPGERVAVVGCGTSLYMAQCFAVLRETAGQGETDAFPASEFPTGRTYDRVVALTRSGTTTEVRRLLTGLAGSTPTVVVTAVPDAPVVTEADTAVVIDFADEESVVQTRFATTALALWRAFLGEDLDPVIAAAEQVLAEGAPPAAVASEQFTFLATGWATGLANEAGLKLREAAQAWTEAYPAMEFRHGPISVIDDRSTVWVLGAPPVGLLDDLAVTHANVVTGHRDPMAQLIGAQLVAVAVAERKGLDPDRPRNLTRSIVLPA